MPGLVHYVVAALAVAAVAAQLPNCPPGETYVPHPTDCNLYYLCSSGQPILQQCPPDLWWNPNLNVCDWPASSGCTASTTTTPAPTTTTGQVSTESESPGTETSSIGTESSSIGTETTSIGTESSSIGTESSSIGTESTSTNVPTESSSSSDIPTEPSGTTTPPSPTTTTQAPTTTTVNPELPNSCPAVEDPDKAVRLPHESRCDWYYLCVNGTKVLHACTSNHQFSYTRRFCFPPNEAGCDSCPTIDTGATIRLPYGPNCNLYYLCIDTEPVLYQCRVDTDHFSRTVRDCMSAEDANCTPTKRARWF